MRQQIPNIITLFNLFLGCMAIVSCFQFWTVASIPIPMIGILTAVFPLIYWQPSFGMISKLLLSPLFWYGYILVVSYLMVITRPMLALKSLSNKKKLFLPLGIVAIEIVVSAIFFKWYAIPFGFIGYCIVSLMYPKTITQ